MNTYQWLCLFGIPTILVGIIGALVGALVTSRRAEKEKDKAVRLGVKALLRGMMTTAYSEYYEKLGYAPLYVKDNFQNYWLQYHAIKGPNGVMDDIHDKFMRLPTEPPENNKEE